MTSRRTRSAPRGRPRDEDRAARRDALLETAMRHFLDLGYGGTTIEEIAAGAQVAKRTIYTTIGDKADLFVAVVRRLGDHAVNPTVSDAASSVAGVRAFGARLVRVMLSDEAVGLHRLVIAEATRFPDLASRLYTNGARRYIAVLHVLLDSLPSGALRLSAVPADEARPENADGAYDLGRQAEALFTQLLGERHRRRLFGLEPAPTDAEIDAHVRATVRRFVHDDYR